MELASPIEVGPKRKVVKPYLDRKITPWGHVLINMAQQDAVVYEANAIKDTPNISPSMRLLRRRSGRAGGYGYDGKPNMPTDDNVEFMKVGARNTESTPRSSRGAILISAPGSIGPTTTSTTV